MALRLECPEKSPDKVSQSSVMFDFDNDNTQHSQLKDMMILQSTFYDWNCFLFALILKNQQYLLTSIFGVNYA